MIHWNHGGQDRSAQWHSEAGVAAPRRVVVADDTLPADAAYRMACEGTALLWQGDFQNARHLLQALMRRADGRGRPRGGAKGRGKAAAPRRPPHRRRPSTCTARPRPSGRGCSACCSFPWKATMASRCGVHPTGGRRWPRPGALPDGTPRVASLRELLGLVGAHEWRKKGVEIPALGAPPDNRIHPHYGVFSPVRGEYIDLVAQVPLPAGAAALAFDIGTGTGVLAAVLARRGVRRVVATDQDPRALACARENLQRLRVLPAVDILQADLFPRAARPWWCAIHRGCRRVPPLPVERAVYDEDSGMLRGFLGGLAEHLEPGGEGWLILSDLAEHLDLRTRVQLLGWIEAAGLRVLGRHDVRPRHGRRRMPPIRCTRRERRKPPRSGGWASPEAAGRKPLRRAVSGRRGQQLLHAPAHGGGPFRSGQQFDLFQQGLADIHHAVAVARAAQRVQEVLGQRGVAPREHALADVEQVHACARERAQRVGRRGRGFRRGPGWRLARHGGCGRCGGRRRGRRAAGLREVAVRQQAGHDVLAGAVVERFQLGRGPAVDQQQQ